MKFNQKLAKRFLAVALSFAMVVTSLFVLPTEVSAASGVTVTDYTSVKAGGTAKFAIKGLKSTQYAKVAVKTTNNVGTVDGTVTAKYANKKVTSSTKIAGGKTRYIYVTNKNCVGETVTITVTVYNKSTNKKVDTVVEKVFVYKLTTSMSIKEADQTIKVGETFDFTGVKAPSNSTQKITWTSSDTAVATVDSKGLVTGVAAGTATITATSGKQSASVVVTVQPGEVVIEDLQATAVNELTVTLNQPINAETKLLVTKGTTKPAVAGIEYVDNKAIITLKTEMKAGDYTVTVGESSKTVTVKDQYIASIEFNSDNAVKSATATGSAIITVTAKDQYGDDFTSALGNVANVKAYSSNGTATVDKNGVVTLKKASGDWTIGEIVVVTIQDNKGTVATATVKIVQSAVVASITLNELTAKDAKVAAATLNVSNMTKNYASYIIPIEVKDQYGNVLKADELKNSLMVTSSNPNVINIDTIKDDAKYGTVITFKAQAATATYGTSVIVVTALGTGVNANMAITVKADAVIDTVELSTPSEDVKAGVAVELPISFVDTYGDAVDLYYATITGKGGNTLTINGNTTVTATNAKFDIEKDYVKKTVSITIEPTAEGPVVINVTTENHRFANLILTADAKPVPTSIYGISPYVALALANDVNLSTTVAGAVYSADQYGDRMSNGADFSSTAAPGKYTIEKLSTGTSSNIDTAGKITASATAGTETYRITLYGKTVNDILDTYDFNVKVIDMANITEFKLDSLNKLYTGASPAHNKAISVYGVYNGEDVVVNQNIVKGVSTNGSNDLTKMFSVSGGAIQFTSGTLNTNAADVTATLTAYVDNPANGATYKLTQEFTYSNASPVAQNIYFYKGNSVVTGAIEISASTLNGMNLNTWVNYADQYGVKRTSNLSYVITSVVANSGTISVTGSTLASTLTAGDTFQLNVYVDGISAEIIVYVTD